MDDEVAGAPEVVGGTGWNDPLSDPVEYNAKLTAQTERGWLKTTPYDPRVAAIVIARVAEGTMLTVVISQYGISMGTIRKWKRKSREFKDALVEAEAMGAQAMVEQAVTIADGQAFTPAEAMSQKLRIEARWKLAEKHAPGRYGSKSDEAGGLEWGKVLDEMNARRAARTVVAQTVVDAQAVPKEATKEVDPI